jgi:cysteine desulfurase/selenocysteine lyase
VTAAWPASAARAGRLVDDRFGRFFDWATVGPVSLAGVAGRNAFLARLDESLHPAAQLRHEACMIDSVRSLVGRFLGATDAHRIVFGRSVSALFSLVATSLAGTRERSTVVLTDTEHPVARLCWVAARRCRLDLRVIVIPPADTGLVDLNAVAAAVDERCVAVCAAHVARMSGVVQPVAALARLAHEAGAVLIVDGAQATGRVPVDLRALGCDVYLGSGQKSLLAGSGITFMAADTALLNRILPLTWSGINARVDGPLGDDALTVVDAPLRFEPEPPDLACAHALRASVEEFLRLGMGNVHQHITGTISVLADAMTEIGLRPRYRPDWNNAGILSYDTAHSHAPAGILAERLCDEGLVVRSVGELLRVSVHLPNNVTEVVELAHAVRRHL